jgi:hypothetical protein
MEDENEARRNALVAALQKRLHRASRNQDSAFRLVQKKGQVR